MTTHQLDGRLLHALYRTYPDGHFDEVNISIDAVRSPELLTALAFLDPKIDRRRRSLSARSIEAVRMWLERIEERDTGSGLQLRRDLRGWCSVEASGAGCADPGSQHVTNRPDSVAPCIVCGAWIQLGQTTPEETCGWRCSGIATSEKWKLGVHPIQQKRKKKAGEPGPSLFDTFTDGDGP
jgi:hypothetical protein